MKHLTTKEIMEFVDGTIFNGERTQVIAHLDECARCRGEVEFHRALGMAVGRSPLESAPARLTERVMNRLVPRKPRAWVQRLLNNLGSLLAMIIVLSILGYALLTPSEWKPSDQPAVLSEVVKTYSDLYGRAQEYIKIESAQLREKTDVPAPSAQTGSIVALTLVSLLILVVLDKVVGRRVLRLRI